MHVTSAPLPPHVLHVTQPVDGGVARVVADLVRTQRAAGMQVSVACPASGELPGMLAALGCEVLEWEASRAPGRAVPGECRRLARIVRHARPQLVHAHSAKAGLAARLVVRGRIPTVFQPHAWSFEAVGGLGARLALAWERRGARWASRLICVSRAEQETGTGHGIEAPWRLVPNGVDLERFRPEGPAADTGDGEGPLVVCVGRLCRQKGQDVLVEAWPDVLARVPGARLVLVGDGPDLDRLRAAAPPSVRFAGSVDDAAPWYRAADLVVLPSRWEGIALAPLEAMACGRPVLVTDVDGARESLPPPLAERCLAPPDDPAALARALSGLLSDADALRALGREAQGHVHAHHDVRRTAKAVTDVYRELLGLETIECREPVAT
ncbi:MULTISPECIES: glycosyltransferase [unclassified Streptomyces]|uniref:glycosyltransferase n=1 Tax=unclassified Streptomyces TaxID=2593676 RepID=UPI000DB9420D|nr:MULTISPECIES: glycosyltransferase [unclassified Streptomyces]MYT73049.1 glycosyltransferase [Streptomyces sp. SID8367]RAJ73846.1 glycosyltransferase involved in cell wall biosynthesis [Streptomyces sp. PsTaAH-137]